MHQHKQNELIELSQSTHIILDVLYYLSRDLDNEAFKQFCKNVRRIPSRVKNKITS